MKNILILLLDYLKKFQHILNKFIVYLNRAVLKDRYNKKGEYLKGFAVMESTPSMDNIHFHITLSDEYGMLPSKERLEDIVERKIKAANRTADDNNRISKSQLQDYFEGSQYSSLEGYLTKNFERWAISEDQKIDSVCPLGNESVSFGK